MNIYEVGKDEEGYPIYKDLPSTYEMMEEFKRLQLSNPNGHYPISNTCGCDECHKMAAQPQEFQEGTTYQKEDEDAPESHTERHAMAVERAHDEYLNNKME